MQRTLQENQEIVVLFLKGRLNASSAQNFEAAAVEKINQGKHFFVIDMSNLEYISSIGLRALLLLQKRLAPQNGKAVLAALSPHVYSIIKMSGYHNLFDIYENSETAFAALKNLYRANQPKGHVAIIDPFSSGKFIGEFIRSKGYKLIHIISSSKLPESLLQKVSSLQCERQIRFDGQIKDLVAELQSFDLEGVFADGETGIALADILAGIFKLPANGSAYRKCCSSRLSMLEAAHAKGVSVAPFYSAKTVDELVKWFRRNDSKAVILKPTKGFRHEAHYITTSEDLSRHARSYLGGGGLYGEKEPLIMLQDCAQGIEFIFNTVSCQGNHTISDCWECRKIPAEGGLLPDYFQLMPYPAGAWEDAVENIFRTLDAISLQHGPAHTVMMETREGPQLIETEAGTMDYIFPPQVISECLGRNHIGLTLDAGLDPHIFTEKASKPYALKKHLMIKILHARTEGVVKSMPGIDTIRTLASYRAEILNVTEGSLQKRTIDRATAPGYILLVHEDPEQMEEDYWTIHRLEEKGLFAYQRSSFHYYA